MRLLPIFPLVCSIIALILTFLCLFAGHTPSFMQDYDVLTLNVSTIGQSVLDNSLSSVWSLLPEDIQNTADEVASEITHQLGIEDFYTLHLLTYCQGRYTPSAIPTTTLSSSAIEKNTTACSASRPGDAFDPSRILSDALAMAGLDITLDDLNWPQDIQDGLDALKAVQKASFVLYCLAIAFSFLVLIGAAIAIFRGPPLAAWINVMLAFLAFLATGLASALVTAVAVKGADVINEHGNDLGIRAHRGGKFLALTWAATALMLITLVAWLADACFFARRAKGTTVGRKAVI